MKVSWCIAFILGLSPTVALAQVPSQTRLGPNCDLQILGVKEKQSFLKFDRDLRAALQAKDAGKISLMVSKRLRVFADPASYLIDDPISLQRSFNTIFPSDVRQAVASTSPESLRCYPDGIFYGRQLKLSVSRGVRGYEISSVDIYPAGRDYLHFKGVIEFACRTDAERVLVDWADSETVRLRSWGNSTPLEESPEIEILAKDQPSYEGTRPCRHWVWKFAHEGTEYTVWTLGCTADDHSPPKDAIGEFIVHKPNSAAVSRWCY